MVLYLATSSIYSTKLFWLMYSPQVDKVMYIVIMRVMKIIIVIDDEESYYE